MTTKYVSERTRAEIQAQRPLMNYVAYESQTWISVEIVDHYAQNWQWGCGPYFDWCDDNCSDKYNIVKYSRDTIYGRFKSEKDATLFALRWAS